MSIRVSGRKFEYKPNIGDLISPTPFGKYRLANDIGTYTFKIKNIIYKGKIFKKIYEVEIDKI